MKHIASVFLFLFAYFFSYSQNYFQQDVSYKLNVTLDDKENSLSGFEEIVYKNNSSTNLNELYFHLYPNAYKNSSTRLGEQLFKNGSTYLLNAENDDLGSIDSLNFKVNGTVVQWELLIDTIDICRIHLNKPLVSGDSVSISTPFKVKIPSAYISRLGHIGQSYFITQWYPKPAVYDKNGWNYFSYLDKGEFYSEFGTYDVTITLPQNYVLGATGERTNSASEEAWLESKNKETVATQDFGTDMSFPASSKELKTIQFKQNNIHDFAWFADKRWHVLKGEVELPKSKRIITTYSFFTNAEADYWKKAPEYIKDGITYMSNWVAEYPFSTFTAVDVTSAYGDGMEYPMITTIGNYGDPFELDLTIVHEIFHNWFYGILGSNERIHPWMDEGFTNFYETRYVYTKYAGSKENQLESVGSYGMFEKILHLEKINHKAIQYQKYIAGARRNTDVSQDQSSDKFSRSNYGSDVYFKTSVSIDYLKSYLGEELFDQCIQQYYNEWKFKHPQPGDLKSVFEKVTNKNLNWFFDDLMRSNKHLDYSISSIQCKSDSSLISLSNKGEISGPLWVSTIRNDEIISTKNLEGFEGIKNISLASQKGDVFKIDANELIPELYRTNNTIKTEGLFKKTERINLRLLTAIENPNRTQLFYIPLVAYNVYNSLMAGIAFHNITFFESPFEFAIAPMYATRTKDLVGGGDLRYHFYPKNKRTSKITLQETIGRYAYQKDIYNNDIRNINYENTLKFLKFDSRLIFSFRSPHPEKKITKELEIRDLFVQRDVPYESNGLYKPQTANYNYIQAEYRRINSNPLEEGSQKITTEYNIDYLKLKIELKQFFTYGQKDKGVNIRFFAGYLNSKKSNSLPNVDYRYNLSGTSGKNDYYYDDIFIGRTETDGVFAHQFIRNAAGFTAPTSFYRLANQWMAGLNASTTLPGLIPFKLYANLGTFNDSKSGFNSENSSISWELGVEFPVVKDVLSVYLPFAYSKDIKYVIDQNDLKTSDLIRFELHLQKLNPLNYIRTTLR